MYENSEEILDVDYGTPWGDQPEVSLRCFGLFLADVLVKHFFKFLSPNTLQQMCLSRDNRLFVDWDWCKIRLFTNKN